MNRRITTRPPSKPSPSGRGQGEGPRRGFTLMELLVAITIILVAVGLSLPLVMAFNEVARGGSGANTVHVAVSAARAYATRQMADDVSVPGASYSGVAIIFTPSGELRLVENNQQATNDSGEYLEDLGLNGYDDIPGRDYMQIPSDVGVVGVLRNAAGDAGLRLLAPPFAVRFNQFGELTIGPGDVSGANISAVVLYDRDSINGIQTNRNRLHSSISPYNPDDWDPTSPGAPIIRVDATTGRLHLPFDVMHAVVGVVLYPKKKFRASVDPITGQPLTLTIGASYGINDSARNWILENGEIVMFGRYSGTILRERSR